MTDNDEIKRAEAQGAQAFRLDVPLTKSPYNITQGSPTRVVGIAWKRGWRQAQQQAEIDEQESLGHFRDVK